MFIVSCATYDPNTTELNSYVLGKTESLQQAQLVITEDIEDYQANGGEEGETDRYLPRSTTWTSKNGFTAQYEIYEF